MSLADQLFRAGVLTEAKYRQHQALRQVEAIQPVKKEGKPQTFVTANDLDSCASMTEFKHAAKEILERDPSQIDAVVQSAHRFKNDQDPAAKKFIWFFYELRDRMRKLKPVEREALMKKAFRRRGSTFELE